MQLLLKLIFFIINIHLIDSIEVGESTVTTFAAVSILSTKCDVLFYMGIYYDDALVFRLDNYAVVFKI